MTCMRGKCSEETLQLRERSVVRRHVTCIAKREKCSEESCDVYERIV